MSASGCGRYAPTPSGDLHIGNLRTAILAWSLARRSGRRFHLRMEDTERVVPGARERQLHDLRLIGIDWDGEVVSQRARAVAHADALAKLTAQGLTYECYCTRKDIREAASAPNAPVGFYPGTCRDLDEAARQRGRRRLAALGRQPALRLRADGARWHVDDAIYGTYESLVDDVVLRRGDGVVAYNLAVVVDDAWAGVDHVCRGDDLLPSAPSQAYIAHLLGLQPTPKYAHVPLVVNAHGQRLAKRDGAVTLADLSALGWSSGDVVEAIGRSLGIYGARVALDISECLDVEVLRRLRGTAWVFTAPKATS
ncbi:tRNA glutamyl-Q(34) synthetase GluQRS [Nanchangia anserum]|uniref:tRNA glutamyl-Q(34) synthetase GluQRS n=1 Tax=Nanchangia anserum TaxID=2692125 RepID=A0A8I0GE38_9ACTO|nr:tRNA glutamyl-Q(34) synthetase GluQRS [Nanchangia anserum]MBD3689838.1 tRNA glutamyl-Q(34) synthetase GluQRS [Nanchangia anserum]QOX82006.1 tRNA glutamyl-Q(34) synthetase GluQRS [Nanchangia anserum]